MTLAQLHLLKQWHAGHRATHAVEGRVWELVVMLWMTGWIGWMPVLTLDVLWAAPLCMLAMVTPDLYARWRLKAHRQQRLRCDWACAVESRSLPRRPGVRR